jgi:hypothetical protein
VNCTGNLASPSIRWPEGGRAVGGQSLGERADPSDRSGEARNVPAVGDGRGFRPKCRERALPQLADLLDIRRFPAGYCAPPFPCRLFTKVARHRSNIYESCAAVPSIPPWRTPSPVPRYNTPVRLSPSPRRRRSTCARHGGLSSIPRTFANLRPRGPGLTAVRAVPWAFPRY